MDLLIHIAESQTNKGNKETINEESFTFLQIQTKEEFDELEKSLSEDSKKREQFVSIKVYMLILSRIDCRAFPLKMLPAEEFSLVLSFLLFYRYKLKKK